MNVTPIFEHNLQLRWADLDSLNHVNNVRYVDFALEAIGRLIEDGKLPDDVPIARIEVDFLRPLMLTLHPIRISSEVDGDRVVQKIRADDVIFATVTTDFESLTARFAEQHDGRAYHAHVRRADLESSGQVSPAKVFELFQEARILHFSRLLESLSAGHFVVAKLTVGYHRPIGMRHEPWPISNWVSKIGSSSIQVSSQLSDGVDVYASCEATLVAFDAQSQKSRKLSEDERDQLSLPYSP